MDKKHYDHVFEAILSLETKADCAAFFEDLCTIKELNDMHDRLAVAQRLLAGETYENIVKETKMSSATISRVNRCIQYGSGGYKRIIKRLK